MITRNKIIFFVITCLIIWKILSFLPSINQEDSLSLADGKDIPTSSKSTVNPLQVAVYYETLCPDSRSFFIRQLLPTYEKAPEILDISLVPYGKASTQKEAGGKYVFKCQHGPTECHGNKVHACAVRYVTPPSLLLRYATCMISDNTDPEEAGRKCARSLGVDWEPILRCSQTDEGDSLLALHGEATLSLQPPASFIPTIEVNKDLQGQPALLKDLFKELCSRFQVLPHACT